MQQQSSSFCWGRIGNQQQVLTYASACKRSRLEEIFTGNRRWCNCDDCTRCTKNDISLIGLVSLGLLQNKCYCTDCTNERYAKARDSDRK